MPLIRLRANETVMTAELLERDSFVSLSTGAELLKLKIRLQVTGKEQSDQVLAIASAHVPVYLLDANGQDGAVFKVGNHDHSFQEGRPVFAHIWEMTQLEQVQLTTLSIGGMDLSPYEYKESFTEDTLRIDARVRLTLAERDHLRALPQYFPVVRNGINDTPEEMRFGQLIWSKDLDGFKYDLVLVAQAYDKLHPKFSMILEPQFGHTRELVAKTSETLAQLLSVLQTRGVLDQSAIDEIERTVSERLPTRLAESYQVDNIDDWE